MWNRDINLITGAPDLYRYQIPKLEQPKPYPKKLVSFLAALLIAETLAIGYYAIVKGNNFKFVPEFATSSTVLPKLSHAGVDLFRDQSGQVLGSATQNDQPDRLDSAQNVADTQASASASASASATPEPTVIVSPIPTETPAPTATPTPKPDFTPYSVQNGDNWWQIVKKQCPNATGMGDLVIFNRDHNELTLHRGDNVKVYCSIP